MKISIEWLKEFLNFSQSSQKIADTLTMLGLEAECRKNSSNVEGVLVGEVKELSLIHISEPTRRYAIS